MVLKDQLYLFLFQLFFQEQESEDAQAFGTKSFLNDTFHVSFAQRVKTFGEICILCMKEMNDLIQAVKFFSRCDNRTVQLV